MSPAAPRADENVAQIPSRTHVAGFAPGTMRKFGKLRYISRTMLRAVYAVPLDLSKPARPCGLEIPDRRLIVIPSYLCYHSVQLFCGPILEPSHAVTLGTIFVQDNHRHDGCPGGLP